MMVCQMTNKELDDPFLWKTTHALAMRKDWEHVDAQRVCLLGYRAMRKAPCLHTDVPEDTDMSTYEVRNDCGRRDSQCGGGGGVGRCLEALKI
jgi:hypothetical protein